MFDRAIKFLAAVLAGLLIFLFGYLAAIVALRPAAAPGLSATTNTEVQGEGAGALTPDLPTKRVKTVPIHPEDVGAAPSATPAQP